MRFNLLSDADCNSGVEHILKDLASSEYRAYFANRSYGGTLNGITIVFVCQPEELNLKPRRRFSKSEGKLYLDVMLTFEWMCKASPQARHDRILNSLSEQVLQVIRKYKFEEFDITRFKNDLTSWVESARYKPSGSRDSYSFLT